MPELMAANGLRYLSGIVTVLWGLEFWFFQRLAAVSSLDGLSSREQERLIFRLASIRRRIWWIGGVELVAALSIWLIVELQLPATSPAYAAMVGELIGICLSYLVLIPAWVNETQSFIDRVRHAEQQTKKRAEVAKVLADATGK